MSRTAFTTLLALSAVVLLVGCGGGEKTAPATDAGSSAPASVDMAAATGAVTGVIAYRDGDPDSAIKMDADPTCQGLHAEPVHTEMIVASDAGQLANAFVYVKEGLEGKSYPAPETNHLLDQVGCQYAPHVSGMMVGQKLVIRNSDPTLHNVHALPSKNEEFNQGQPFQGMELERTFDQAEVMVRFKCDVHPWMSSYMAVLDHPFFAVTGEDGSFEIDGLPAGDYLLEAWHEELGTQTLQVSVAPDAAAAANFDFSPAATSAG